MTDPTTALREVLALSEKATEGDWQVVDSLVYSLRFCGWKKGVAQFENATTIGVSGDNSDDDATLIAAAVNLVRDHGPALLSALEDARRWQHARKLLTVDDIEGAQGSFDSFGGLVSEEECAKADAAIDAAIAEGEG